MKTIVPARLLFRFELCINKLPKNPSIKGDLKSWKPKQLMPPLGEIESQPHFAPVWIGWTADGIGIATKVRGKKRALKCDPAKFWQGDNLRLMVNTRDTPNIKRGTRYCQHFYFLPAGGPGDRCVAGSWEVQRSKEDAPDIDESQIQVASQVLEDGYNLEAFIPAHCLSSFEPLEHSRIGLFYILEDQELGQQSLTIGDEMPWHTDPSLWATADLV